MPHHLTSLETVTIRRMLGSYAQEHGQLILGSQLGLLVANTIRPRLLRDYGGLRRLVDEQLSTVVQPAPTLGSADISYLIRAEEILPTPSIAFGEQSAEVVGHNLWRYFSNPRLDCELWVRPKGEVFAIASGAAAPADAKPIQRPTADDYKALARQFAESQAEPLRSSLLTSFDQSDFYNGWIQSLRSLRTLENNLLKQWEILRSDYVAATLTTRLSEAGVPLPSVQAVVLAARPPVNQKPMRVPIELAARNPAAGIMNLEAQTGDDFLKTLVHQAVDLMSEAELRAVKIPAGVLQDAVRRLIK